MNAKQRVRAALTHRGPDRVPCDVRCTVDMEEKMVAFTGKKNYRDDYIEPIIQRIELEPDGQWAAPGMYKDVFGLVWNRSVDKNYGVVENPIVTPSNFGGYKFPEPMPDEYIRKCVEKARAGADEYVLGRLNLSLWERAWSLRGMEYLMMDMISDPRFAKELFGRICDYNCQVLERTLKYVPVDGIHFGDDWGTQTGLQMSPDMWREFIKPHLDRMYSIVIEAGKLVSIHSCGKVQELFDDFIELGVSSFNPFQPEVIDVDWAVANYGRNLCFYGGISTQVTLPFGTAQETYEQTKHLLEMGKDGGMIVCPAHSIPPGAKPENVIAMLEAMRDCA